jgi:hypothetical protein
MPKRLRGLEVDDQLELGRLFHWEISRLRVLENPVHIVGGAAG